ncbi:MAG: bactofilin family protein [Solirubrobacteraceae bacterium]
MTMQTGTEESLARAPSRQSLIDRESHFNGAYTTSNDLRIEGRYEGEIDCEGTLVVAESADVNARVGAGNISVAGQLQGEIGCHGRFEILPTGRVGGRVVAGTIVVHEGARYDGELRMRGEETGERGARPAAPAARRRPATLESSEVPSFTPPTTRGNGRAPAEQGTPQTPPAGTGA